VVVAGILKNTILYQALVRRSQNTGVRIKLIGIAIWHFLILGSNYYIRKLKITP